MTTTATAKTPAVPMHPEAVAGHPELMVWVVPDGTLPVVGRLRHAPGDLGELISGGPLAAATILPGGGRILIRLGDGASWHELGARVRTALHSALQVRDDWVVDSRGDAESGGDADSGGDAAGDELIREAAEAVIGGAFGAYVASHGGRVTLVDVTAGVAGIRFDGACRTCPAAAITMSVRFERDLRARCPVVRGVRRC